MTKHNKDIGAWGEEIAGKWLAERGYQIVAHDVRTPYGELDVIAKRGDVTIFIEVTKLTSSEDFFPEHNITVRKREHMLACADHYASEKEIDLWQIDVMAIEGSPNSMPMITHFQNAV